MEKTVRSICYRDFQNLSSWLELLKSFLENHQCKLGKCGSLYSKLSCVRCNKELTNMKIVDNRHRFFDVTKIVATV